MIKTLAKLNRSEIGVILIVIAIWMMIIIPPINDMDTNEKADAIKANMRIAQIAAEQYNRDMGKYPEKVDNAYLSYFPGGGADGATPAPKGPINPFTKQPEFPIDGPFPDPAVNAVRYEPPKETGAKPGQIQYSYKPFSYAIVGTGKMGVALQGPNRDSTLILSNE